MPKPSSSSGSVSNSRFKGRKLSAPSSSGAAAKFTRHTDLSGRKAAKDLSESIPTEVIDEESMVADSKDDSIKEESIANEIDSYDDEAKMKKSTESIAEDSIIKEEYADDNFASYNAS